MNGTLQAQVVELPGQLVAEIEAVRADTNLDSFVYQAIRAYTASIRKYKEEKQLAADYDQLATIYDELAAELADEVWLPLENEALLQLEQKQKVRA